MRGKLARNVGGAPAGQPCRPAPRPPPPGATAGPAGCKLPARPTPAPARPSAARPRPPVAPPPSTPASMPAPSALWASRDRAERGPPQLARRAGSNPAIGQFFPSRLWTDLGSSPIRAGGPRCRKPWPACFLAMDAVSSRRWTPEYSDRLAELEHEADQLTGQDTSAADRAMVTTMLAAVNAVRTQQRSASPRPEEHPSAEEYARVDSRDRIGPWTYSRGPPRNCRFSTATGLSASLHAQGRHGLLVDLFPARHRGTGPSLLGPRPRPFRAAASRDARADAGAAGLCPC